MSCVNVQNILGSECIGDSLTKINFNFESLLTGLCQLSAQVAALDIPSDYVQSIEAGDGILVDGEPGEIGYGDVLVEAYNSIQYIPSTNMRGVFTRSVVNLPLEDGTLGTFLQFPYTATVNAPAATFETVAMGSKTPALTLYWTVTSSTNNFTVYGTASALEVKPKTQKSNFYASKAIYASCLDGNTLYVGGAFTKLGITARARFGIIDLIATSPVNGGGGGNTSSGGLRLGPIGALSAVSQSLTTGGQILDGLNGKGFNSNVNTITLFKNNNSQYLCVGGAYTNTGIGASGGNRFTIFNRANYNEVNAYNFNNTVHSTLSAGNFLYVCGAFTQGKRGSAPTFITMKGLTRINMTNLEIDTEFTDRVNATITTGGGKYPIRTMAFHENFLYVGGNHEIKVGKNYSNRFASVHTTVSTPGLPEPGSALETWKPVFNGAVYKVFVDPSTQLSQSTLYVGGAFTRYRTSTTTDQVRNRAAAFSVAVPSTPVLAPSWDPSFNKGIWGFENHSTSTEDPIYVSGEFTTVNGAKASYLAALTKANAVSQNDQVITSWRPQPNASFASPKPGMIRIPTTNSLSGIVIHGAFTAVAGKTRSYIARIPGVAETAATQISAVAWEVNGTLIGNGGDITISSENAVMLTAAPDGDFSVNATTFTNLGVFEGMEKGDILRFSVVRPVTAANTFSRDAMIVGASVDFAPNEKENE